MAFWSLGRDNPREEEMATHSSILAWRIPWTEETGGLQGCKEQDTSEEIRASLVAQRVKHWPTMRETRVQSLDREDPLEKEMATHSSTLAWKTPRMEESGGLQSMGPQRVGHDWATSLSFFLSFRLWETSQTSEEPIIYCVEFETRKDKNVKLNPQS